MAGRPRQNDEAPQGAAASLLNGLGVLEAFSIEKPVLGVTEIALRVGLHKSTVSRILAGLEKAGYVQRDDETGRFRLGLGLIALSGPLLAELDVRRVAYPELERLTDATLETSALAVWNGSEAVVVEQIPSPHQVKHTAAIGTRYSKFESSSVRMFLAALPEPKAASLLEQGLVARKPESALTADFAGELHAVREAGYAVNDGLTTPEEFGVSALVRDYKGAVVGCITASAPKSRVPESVVGELAARVVAAAAAVSARLGYPAPEGPAEDS